MLVFLFRRVFEAPLFVREGEKDSLIIVILARLFLM